MRLIESIVRPLKFDRPIFLVGCARSGTTIFSALIAKHPEILLPGQSKHFTQAISSPSLLLDYHTHLNFSKPLEKKEVWSRFFREPKITLDIGKELLVEDISDIGWLRKAILDYRLRTEKGGRLFLKSPTNSFRVLAIQKLIKNAIFLIIHRDGRDVISSWGMRPYGFSKLGYENGIELFSRKWNETIDTLLRAQKKIPMMSVKYEDLVKDPAKCMRLVYEYCLLDSKMVDFSGISLADKIGQWRLNIPSQYHSFLNALTERNRKRLGYPV